MSSTVEWSLKSILAKMFFFFLVPNWGCKGMDWSHLLEGIPGRWFFSVFLNTSSIIALLWNAACSVSGQLEFSFYCAEWASEVLFLCIFLSKFFFFMLAYGWLTLLHWFPGRVIQLYIYMYPFFFKFFSHLGYYSILNKFPCIVQYVLVGSF